MQVTLPNKPKVISELEKDNEATFEIEACYPGYGTTLGNSLRRALLSSLPGAAIVGVKIKGVDHEFSTIPYVVEDVIQIILNLKQVRLKMHTEESLRLTLRAKGEKNVKAGDIKTVSGVEIINKEAPIATLTNKKAELDMELEAEAGLGYLPVEQRKEGKLEIGKIAIDADFSPVRKVNYFIENIRVGERTDYDRIQLTIGTDGTITPREAFIEASKILANHYKIFSKLEEKASARKKDKKKTETKKVQKEESSAEKDAGKTKIEEMKISPRAKAALEGAGIKTAAGLARKSEDDLKEIEGLGGKGIKEIKRILGRLGLTLKH